MSTICDDLRAAILQAAMQGKLTEQLSEDGNAEDLLENIKAKKESLIESGSIRRQPTVEEILENDMPFVIPDSWKWIRVGDLGMLESGFSFKSSDYKEQGIQVVRISDLGEDEILTKNTVYYPDDPSLAKFEIKTNSILICLTGSIGKMALVTDSQKRYLNQRVGMFSLYDESILGFLWRILHAESIKHDWVSQKTSTNGNIKNEVVLNTLIPLPPVAEQKRIVEKIDELMARVADLEQSADALASLKKAFPDDIKASLLQAAMQGKLTKQLPEDGNAEDLLEEIKAEKEKLIAEGKIKKQKPLAPITDDEIPFGIPENWKWARWGDLSFSIEYGANLGAKEKGTAKLVRISDIQHNTVIWKNTPFCEASNSDIEKYQLSDNDILFARTGGTVGKSVIVSDMPKDEKYIYAGYLIRSNYSRLMSGQYLKIFMDSELYWDQLRSGTTKTAQPNCNGVTLSKMIIPIPPITEQERIVERLASLMQNINVVGDLIASE